MKAKKFSFEYGGISYFLVNESDYIVFGNALKAKVPSYNAPKPPSFTALGKRDRKDSPGLVKGLTLSSKQDENWQDTTLAHSNDISEVDDSEKEDFENIKL